MGDLSQFDFNANDHEDVFSPLPEGDYPCAITDAHMKANKAGTGSYLQVELTVTGPLYTGRKLFDRFNLENPSEKAVSIAQAQFAGLCKAVGVLEPQDSSELINKNVVAVAGIDGTYNVVKRYKAAEGVVVGSTKAASSAPSKKNSGKHSPPSQNEFKPGRVDHGKQDPSDEIPF